MEPGTAPGISASCAARWSVPYTSANAASATPPSASERASAAGASTGTCAMPRAERSFISPRHKRVLSSHVRPHPPPGASACVRPRQVGRRSSTLCRHAAFGGLARPARRAPENDAVFWRSTAIKAPYPEACARPPCSRTSEPARDLRPVVFRCQSIRSSCPMARGKSMVYDPIAGPG